MIKSESRQEFERWAESSGWNIDRTDEGDYRTMSTDAAWGAWLACTLWINAVNKANKVTPNTEYIDRVELIIGRIYASCEVLGIDISGSTTGQGAFAVADPRAMHRGKGDAFLTGGHYGVVPWAEHCGAVSSSACHDNGNFSVADPRIPLPDEKTDAVIISLDGTRHRPFTTFELAALQGLVCPEEQLELDGLSDQAWRERIGNAVPAPAAQAIASEMFRTLLLAWTGSTMSLALTPIWVRPVAVAMNLARGSEA